MHNANSSFYVLISYVSALVEPTFLFSDKTASVPI